MISNTVQIYHISPISKEIVKDFLTKFDKLILELFHDVSRYCPINHMTVKTIAKRVGCSERHVSRVTTKLNDLGLIRKYRKFIGKREKCWYKVMPQFLGMFKKEVKKFLDAGPKFAIRILASAATKIKNVSVVNINYIYNKFKSIKETYSKRESISITKRIKEESSKREKVTYPVKSNEPKGQSISSVDKLKQEMLSWVIEEPENLGDPIAKIKDWIKWYESPDAARFIHAFGFQLSPDLKWALEQGGLSNEVKERFFRKYPIVRPYFR